MEKRFVRAGAEEEEGGESGGLAKREVWRRGLDVELSQDSAEGRSMSAIEFAELGCWVWKVGSGRWAESASLVDAPAVIRVP